MAELQKAEIFRVDDPSTKVICQFNPKDFSITKNVKWNRRTISGKDVSDAEFAGGEPQNFQVDLVFDTTDTGSDVREKYKELLIMGEVDPSKKNSKTQKSEPPLCKFQWGSYLSFTGVLTQIRQSFTMFKADGTPVRARVNVTFGEVPKESKSQNPTTRSEARKIWVVHEGQRLDWIAYQEYGDASQWRHIAQTNGLANPIDLSPGLVLKLVPLP
ncbi:peptidoglycan-binding protein [Chloroflexota bacterium]